MLAAFEDEEDPRIDELGVLGVGANQAENQLRLANLARTIRPHVATGAIALVADLQPAKLQAQADGHAAINKQKGSATASRQSDRKTLEDERDDTRGTLKRVRAFLIAQKQPLTAFGFDLPVPPRRPRLVRGEPPVKA